MQAGETDFDDKMRLVTHMQGMNIHLFISVTMYLDINTVFHFGTIGTVRYEKQNVI